MYNKDGFTYLFDFDYGSRLKEKIFIYEVLQKFDNNSLVGSYLSVNNNVYHLEFYFVLIFEKEQTEFEKWIKVYYPEKYRVFNIYPEYLMLNNMHGLIDGKELDLVLTKEANHLFVFPERDQINSLFPPSFHKLQKERVFICHASEDKEEVLKLFEILQSKEIPSFIDEYEIKFGETIDEAIQRNLQSTKIALICYSKAFVTKVSEWISKELSFFEDNNLVTIPINMDLESVKLEEIIGSKKFVNYNDEEDLMQLVFQLKETIRRI